MEGSHGTYGGRSVGVDGRADRPIVGLRLDGTGVDNFGSPLASIPDTDNGRWDGDRQFDRAIGPLQFIPQSWERWKRDGDGDGETDPFDIDDAALATAAYLCNYGNHSSWDTWKAAVFGYNHSVDYVNSVKSSFDRIQRVRLPAVETEPRLRPQSPFGTYVPLPQPEEPEEPEEPGEPGEPAPDPPPAAGRRPDHHDHAADHHGPAADHHRATDDDGAAADGRRRGPTVGLNGAMVPDSVRAAFGAEAEPELLAGGAGTTVRCGELVLKPAGEPAEAAWTQHLASLVEPDDDGDPPVRVPPPIATADGRWLVDGWIASRHRAPTARGPPRLAADRRRGEALLPGRDGRRRRPTAPPSPGPPVGPGNAACVGRGDRAAPAGGRGPRRPAATRPSRRHHRTARRRDPR